MNFILPIRHKAADKPEWIWFAATFLLLSIGTIACASVKLDTRFALMVEDMRYHGMRVFATLFSYDYADYPSLWVAASWVTTLGGRWITQWSLALPTILCGSLISALVYRIGALYRKEIGHISAGLLLSAGEYLYVFYGFGIDAPVCLIALILFYLLEKKVPLSHFCWIFALLLIMGFFVRGPLGMILPGAAVAGYILLQKEWRKVIILGVIGAGTLVFCCVGVWQLILQTGGSQLWETALRWQFGKRVSGGDHFYYFYQLPAWAPVSLAMLALVIFRRKQLLHDPVFPWFGFIFLPMILMSFPGCKHLRYVTLCIPVMALLGGWCIVQYQEFPRIRKILSLLNTVFPWLGIPAFIVLAVTGYFNNRTWHLPYLQFGCALVVLIILGITARYRRQQLAQWLSVFAVLSLFFVWGINPLISYMEDASQTVTAMEKLPRRLLIFYNLGPDHEDLKYLALLPYERRQQIVYMMEEFTNDEHYDRMFYQKLEKDLLKRIQPEDLIILQERKMEQIESLTAHARKKIHREYRGKIGHRHYWAVRILPAKP